jgi:aryl-alcohol dehydrogenase-like predicted oxidoreductase
VQATWNLLEPSAAPALARAHGAGWLVVVKEAVANGRLTSAGDEPRADALAAADGQAVDAYAIGVARAQPWSDVVLSGAVTAEQLASNLASRAPTAPRATDAAPDAAPDAASAALAALAEDPAAYWAARSARAWT